MNTGVLLVDDEQLIRAGLRAIIAAEPDLEVVGEAADGSEVPGLVSRLRPDVVLMDLRMPTVDGIRATAHLMSTVDAPPKVIVVTTFDSCSSGPVRRRSSRPSGRSFRGSPCSSRPRSAASRRIAAPAVTP
jgi:chemotaxis response regulator CheB